MNGYSVPASFRLATLFSVASVCLFGLSLIAVGAIARAATMGAAAPMVAAAVLLALAGLGAFVIAQRLWRPREQSQPLLSQPGVTGRPGWAR